jgi:hypothetical protein
VHIVFDMAKDGFDINISLYTQGLPFFLDSPWIFYSIEEKEVLIGYLDLTTKTGVLSAES